MSNRYEADEKATVMVLLERNHGDVQRTADQTGIPDRTIYRWQRQILAQLRRYTPLSPQTAGTVSAEVPAFANDLEALAFIRQNIIGELSRLSASLQHDPGFTTPYQRALVMSQLMDKMMKLDLHLQPYVPQERQIIRIKGDEEHGVSYDDDDMD